jgi:hypothetical protein
VDKPNKGAINMRFEPDVGYYRVERSKNFTSLVFIIPNMDEDRQLGDPVAMCRAIHKGTLAECVALAGGRELPQTTATDDEIPF